MSGDWIKMRTELYRDPKVIVMADALMQSDSQLSKFVNQNTRRDMTVTRNVMRNVTVGALVSVWGVLRHQGTRVDDDLCVYGVMVSVVDDIADLPGFGDAMVDVEWLEQTSEGIRFPRFFEENNTDPREQEKAKNRERQKRYRDNKRNDSNVMDNVTRNVTDNANSNARREESRERVEEKNRTDETKLETEKTAPKRARAKYTSDFEDFWILWKGTSNGHRNKPEAFREWKHAIASAASIDADWLKERATAYIASDTGRSQYAVKPSNWLKEAGYDAADSAWVRKTDDKPGIFDSLQRFGERHGVTGVQVDVVETTAKRIQ